MAKYLTDADVSGATSYGDDNLFVNNFAWNSETNIDTLVKEFFDGGKPSNNGDDENDENEKIIVQQPLLYKKQKKYMVPEIDVDKILILIILITFISLILIQQSKYNTLSKILHNSLLTSKDVKV